MSIASPPSISAASRIASGRVGWGGTVLPISWNVASSVGATERREGELRYLHGNPALARLLLGEPDRGDLGLAIDARRDLVGVRPMGLDPGHHLHRRHPFRGRLVGQEHPSDDVADRMDRRTGGPEPMVHPDEPPLELHAARLQAQPLRKRLSTYRDQDLLCGNRLFLPPRGHRERPLTLSSAFAVAEVRTRIPRLRNDFASSSATSRSTRGRSWSIISMTVTSAPKMR